MPLRYTSLYESTQTLRLHPYTDTFRFQTDQGNRFSIVLHHINEKDAKCFETTSKLMQREGIPNYYGYQRFGEDGKSYLQGKEIAQSW